MRKMHLQQASCIVLSLVSIIALVKSSTPQVFDFIIAGGGTAGCVLASRLSENGKFSVLVLEAGGIPPDFLSVPAFTKQYEEIPELTFGYQSVPQRVGLGNNNGIIGISLGRALGGTSNINYNVFNRGSPHDYDNWADVAGDASWRYSNMLKYFKRSETYLGEFPSNQHGFKGPITVSKQIYAPGKEPWLEAGKELGYSIRDPNGPQEISFTPVEFTRKFGRRVNAYTGYIKPILGNRPNLSIILNAYVTKVLFDGNAATGVKYHLNGTTFIDAHLGVAIARKEVILSAGAYGSPTLLMRSGVGPKDVLRRAAIPQLKELPVGENFQEHPILPIHFILNNKSLALDPQRDLTPENFELFQRYGQGPYTSIAGHFGQAFLPSPVARQQGHPDWADMHIVMAAVTQRLPQFVNMNIAPWETSITMNLYNSRCKSRGSVKLNPENVKGPPIIDFNYIGNPLDEEIFLGAINATLNIFEKTNAYRKAGARYPSESVKGCGHLKFRSEGYWRCYMRQTMLHGNHPSGTCSMNSVVDSSLRVIGLKNLRVVDASVMPYITNANLQAAIYGIAEKASDMILSA